MPEHQKEYDTLCTPYENAAQCDQIGIWATHNYEECVTSEY